LYIDARGKVEEKENVLWLPFGGTNDANLECVSLNVRKKPTGEPNKNTAFKEGAKESGGI